MHPLRELFKDDIWINKVLDRDEQVTIYGDKISHLYCYTEEPTTLGVFLKTSFVKRALRNNESFPGLDVFEHNGGAAIDEHFTYDQKKDLIRNIIPEDLYDDIGIEFLGLNTYRDEHPQHRLNLVIHIINEIFSIPASMGMINRISPYLNTNYNINPLNNYDINTNCIYINRTATQKYVLSMTLERPIISTDHSLFTFHCPPDMLSPIYSVNCYIRKGHLQLRSLVLKTQNWVRTSYWVLNKYSFEDFLLAHTDDSKVNDFKYLYQEEYYLQCLIERINWSSDRQNREVINIPMWTDTTVTIEDIDESLSDF
jgi:hypothetical protein